MNTSVSRPLHKPLFRALWIAAVASNIGTWMQNVGGVWLMTSLTPSPLMVALMQTATSLPVFLVGLPAGALADIVDRRRLLLFWQGWMLVAAALLALLTLVGGTTPSLLLTLTFALGLGAAMNAPAWQAIIPELVSRDELPAAVTLNGVGINLARAVGPALGGIVVAAAGPEAVFLLNAASFVGVIFVLYRWKRSPRKNALPTKRVIGAIRSVLPPHYLALGAYPTSGTWTGVHRTYRKGMREFNHDSFSRLYQDEDKANFQLHTWEYFIAEELEGYVITESAEGLEHFQGLECYGCKFGKEGFAIVTEVSKVFKLERQIVAVHPSTLLPMEALLQSGQFTGGCDIYNLYRYQWSANTQTASDQAGFLDQTPTAADGFIPFVAAYFPKETSHPPELDYYTNGEINIPAALVDLLRGEVHV